MRSRRLRMRWWRFQQWYWGWRYPESEADLWADYTAVRHELWKVEHGWSDTRTLGRDDAE